MSNKEKGILYALATALVIGAGFIPARKAMEIASAVEVNFIWYLFISFFYVIIFLVGKDVRRAASEIKKNIKGVLLVGVLSALCSFLWFYEIGVAGTVNTVFILQFTPLIAVLLDVIILKERFSLGEMAGGMIAVFGALIFSWKNIDLSGAIILLLLFNALMFAITNLLAKIYIKNIDPVILSAGRALVTFLFFAIVFLSSKEISLVKTMDFWFYTLGGSILGIAGLIFFYKSFYFIEASKSQLARTPEPLFTLVFSFLLLGAVPTFNQITGGVLIVTGVAILVFSKSRLR